MRLEDAHLWGNRLAEFGDLSDRRVIIWGPGVGIGDWANATIGFRELTRRYPGIVIEVVAGGGATSAYLRLCPYISRVIHPECSPPPREDYAADAVGINFQRDDDTLWKRPDGSYTGTLERQFAQFGLPIPENHSPQFDIPTPLLCEARRELERFGLEPGRTIVHHCGAVNPALRWPAEHVVTFAAFAGRLGYKVAVVGQEHEWKGPEATYGLQSFVGKHSLQMTVALMTMAGYYVGGHSGPNCIGGGLPIKMISMYAYEDHHSRWSAGYSNSYDLMMKDPQSRTADGNHLYLYGPELVYNIFEQLVQGNLQLPYKKVIA
jgi:ADP-heptose:LPS heptosyltransferase